MSKVIAALDMSLSGTGITILDNKGDIIHQEKLSSKKMTTKQHKNETQLRIIGPDNSVIKEEYIPTSNLLDMRRIAFYKDRIVQLFKEKKVTDVVIEGYSFNSQGRSVISLGELGGVIRFALYEMGIPYTQCPPYNAKAFMTGLAWVKKEPMQAAILEKYGIWIEDDNIADAFAMAQMKVTFQDTLEEYCTEGGVDKLKELKAMENREKFAKDKLEIFKRNLKIGKLSELDFKHGMDAIKDKSLKEKSEILVIPESELEAIEKKKLNLKKFNEKYKLKKPKKDKKKKTDEESEED